MNAVAFDSAAEALPALPRWPRAWYTVGRAAELPPGAVTTGRLAGREYVLFRSGSGALAAFDAHCPHMGAHLRGATVAGERLRCPLHHWTIGSDGSCRGPGADSARLLFTRIGPAAGRRS
jgi:phenylpropionate dioxygenase-like ring-hydroxylating dioxygenase large terminal subunit